MRETTWLTHEETEWWDSNHNLPSSTRAERTFFHGFAPNCNREIPCTISTTWVRVDTGFEPGAAWWEARTLPLCRHSPRAERTYSLSQKTVKAFWRQNRKMTNWFLPKVRHIFIFGSSERKNNFFAKKQLIFIFFRVTRLIESSINRIYSVSNQPYNST